jgi:hypothetical protein
MIPDIHGWTDGLEDYYREIVGELPDGSMFAEVGVLYGKSLIHAATEARRIKKSLKFYAVDHFRGSDEDHQKYDPVIAEGRLRQVFERNIENYGVEATILEGNSTDIASIFPDNFFGFTFLDASHDYDSVCADIRAWLPKTRILAGHDYRDPVWPDVARAVHDTLGEGNIRAIGTCWEHRR